MTKVAILLQALVDIGAGIGMFSLAAASRGHPVIAFEQANNSLQSFQASIDYNGFGKLITLHQVPFSDDASSYSSACSCCNVFLLFQ